MSSSQIATLVWFDIAWISFLIFCCFLPSACAYHRRRRNAAALADALRDNFSRVQSRLAEIERRRNDLDGNNGDGNGDNVVVDFELQEEKLREDWECLEQLFGPIPMNTPHDNHSTNNDTSPSGNTTASSTTTYPQRIKNILFDIFKYLGFSTSVIVIGSPSSIEWGVHQRKQERGRRLVAALKGTSMVVRECNLIANNNNKNGGDDYCCGDEDRGSGIEEAGAKGLDGHVNEGDIELGNSTIIACDDVNLDGSARCDVIEGDIEVGNSIITCDSYLDENTSFDDDKGSENGNEAPDILANQSTLYIESGDGTKFAKRSIANESLSSPTNESDPENNINEISEDASGGGMTGSITSTSTSTSTVDNISTAISSSSHPPAHIATDREVTISRRKSIDDGGGTSPSTVDAVTTPTSPPSLQKHPNDALSLHNKATENLHDYDDGDNKYVALCIPCNSSPSNNASSTSSTQSKIKATPTTPMLPSSSSSSTTTTSTTTIIAPVTKTRLVPATCAICLTQYTPGCYVSWSANKECTHAFHRDCIFMWLLKNEEEMECPCCRGEFILGSDLNAGGGGGGCNGGDGVEMEDEDFSEEGE